MDKGWWLLPVASALLLMGWVMLVPPWQAPDEPLHARYAALLGSGGIDDPVVHRRIDDALTRSLIHHRFWLRTRQPLPGTPGQPLEGMPLLEASSSKLGKPPLYHLLLAGLAQLIPDTADWADRLLLAGRGLAAAISLGWIMMVRQAGRRLFPEEPWAGDLAALGLLATPQVLHIGTSLSPDCLVNFLAALAFTTAIPILRGRSTRRDRTLLWLSVVAGLLTKRSGWMVALALLAAIGSAGTINPHRRRQLGWVGGAVGLTLVPLLFVRGPRFLEDLGEIIRLPVQLIRDPARGLRPVRSLGTLWSSSWGNLGWMTHPLPWPVLVGVALGVGIGLVGIWRLRRRLLTDRASRGALVFGIVVILAVLVRGTLMERIQGRYLFAGYAVLAPLAARGWLALIRPARLRWLLAVILPLIGVAGIAWSTWIFQIQPPEGRQVAEARALLQAFPEPGRWSLSVQAGTRPARAVLTEGFYPGEVQDGFRFAWARARTRIRLFGFGGQSRRVSLQGCSMLLGEESGRRLTWLRSDGIREDLCLDRCWKPHELSLPGGDARESWRLEADTELRPDGDRRRLSWALSELRVEPEAGGIGQVRVDQDGVHWTGPAVRIPEIPSVLARPEPELLILMGVGTLLLLGMASTGSTPGPRP